MKLSERIERLKALPLEELTKTPPEGTIPFQVLEVLVAYMQRSTEEMAALHERICNLEALLGE